MRKILLKNYCRAFYHLLVLFAGCNMAVAQTRPVVVIPLGSDVSSAQFNELVGQFNDLAREINQQRVLAGRVSGDGTKQGDGGFVSVRFEEGKYSISYRDVLRFGFKPASPPAITVTSFGTHRIPQVTDTFGFSTTTPDGTFYTTLNFTVILRAFDNNIADGDFSFMVKKPQGS